MTYVNRKDYVVRKVGVAARDWWLIKNDASINVGRLKLPKEFIGQKVRIHVEKIEPKNLKTQKSKDDKGSDFWRSNWDDDWLG